MLSARLKKVHFMANNNQQSLKDSIQKLYEFIRLDYPRKWSTVVNMHHACGSTETLRIPTWFDGVQSLPQLWRSVTDRYKSSPTVAYTGRGMSFIMKHMLARIFTLVTIRFDGPKGLRLARVS